MRRCRGQNCAGWEQERWASRLSYECPGQAGIPGGLWSEEVGSQGDFRQCLLGGGAPERSQGAAAIGVGIVGRGEVWGLGWQGGGRERDRESAERAEA